MTQPHPQARAALEALAGTLDRRDFTVTLTGEDSQPSLDVASLHCPLKETVFADARFYFWPWGQPIATVGNPKAAAEKISYVLASPGHRRG